MGTATATATDTTDVNEDDNREQDGGRGETRAGRERVKMSLPNGSLFVMQGESTDFPEEIDTTSYQCNSSDCLSLFY